MSTYPPESRPLGGTSFPAPAPAAVPVRPARRPAVVGAGVALVAVGAVAAFAAVHQAGTKTHVLAVAHSLHYGQQITADDLTVAHIAGDPALSPIAAADKSSVIGKFAATDVPAGSLLIRDDLAAGAIPGPGKVLVGVPVKNTSLPVGGVHSADHIKVISTPGPNDDPNSTTAGQSVSAVVVSIGDADNSGIIVINVEASASDAPALTAWGATGRLAVVVQPRG